MAGVLGWRIDFDNKNSIKDMKFETEAEFTHPLPYGKEDEFGDSSLSSPSKWFEDLLLRRHLKIFTEVLKN